MSSSITDPFLLASYDIPAQQQKKEKGRAIESADTPYIFATWHETPRGADGQVTVAVQGDGIHVLDLTDFHPVSSHSLGPSTRFACAPSSSVLSENDHLYRYTFACISASPEVKEPDASRTIWAWKDGLADDLPTAQAKQILQLSHDAMYILSSQHLPDSVLFISSNGELTCTDFNLSQKFTWKPSTSARVLKASVLSRAECNFIENSAELPPNGVLLLLFFETKGRLAIESIAIGKDGERIVIGAVEGIMTVENVTAISCHSSGFVTVLENSGQWAAFRLDVSKSRLRVSSISTTLNLRGFSFCDSEHSEQAKERTAAILSLGSSYVLLAGLTSTETPQIALLLWDMQFGVLLHSHLMALPSTASRNPRLELISCSTSQVLLCLSPQSVSGANRQQLRSSVYVVPYTVASSSSIAAVIGKAGKGSQWLVREMQGKGNISDSVTLGSIFVDEEHGALLQQLQDAIEEERPLDADKLFFDWVELETSKLKAAKTAAERVEEAMDTDDRPDQAEKEDRKHIDTRLHLTDSFTTRLLHIILPAEESGKVPPYSPRIVRYLLERKLVSNRMLDEGLLSALLLRKDWDSITLAFRFVNDMSEEDTIRALAAVIKSFSSGQSDPDDAMQLDQQEAPTKTPKLTTFLANCVSYPSSPVPLRKAFKKHLSDLEDILVVLEIIEKWIADLAMTPPTFSLGEVVTGEHGVPTVKSQKHAVNRRKRWDVTPELEEVLLYLQAILDSSFLRLLQHPPSYEILQRISNNLDPQISYCQSLETLKGPLVPFAKAQSKALAEAREGRKKDAEVDWRKRRKQMQEQNALSIGPYQVEELIF